MSNLDKESVTNSYDDICHQIKAWIELDKGVTEQEIKSVISGHVCDENITFEEAEQIFKAVVHLISS